MSEILVTTQQLAAMLTLTPRRVQQLAQAGVIERRSAGQYDAVQAVPAYLRQIGVGDDPMKGKRLKDAYQAARLEAQLLKNEETKGTLIDKAGVERHVFEFVRGIRDVILAFPSRHAATIAAEIGVDPAKLGAVLTKKLTDVLRTIADTRKFDA